MRQNRSCSAMRRHCDISKEYCVRLVLDNVSRNVCDTLLMNEPTVRTSSIVPATSECGFGRTSSLSHKSRPGHLQDVPGVSLELIGTKLTAWPMSPTRGCKPMTDHNCAPAELARASHRPAGRPRASRRHRGVASVDFGWRSLPAVARRDGVPSADVRQLPDAQAV